MDLVSRRPVMPIWRGCGNVGRHLRVDMEI